MYLPDKKKFITRVVLGVVFAVISALLAPTYLYAAPLTSVGIASYVPVNSDRVENGDIIVSTNKGYTLSTKPYDPALAGVIDGNPAIAFKNTQDKKSYPLVDSDSVTVKVNGENGNIVKGDFVTSSSMKGVGMKAGKGGYVLGKALEAVSFKKASEVKFIAVKVRIQMIEDALTVPNFLVSFLSLSTLATNEQPIKVFQYVVAAVIVIASFSFGFLIFARVVNTGIQALGRNPLAGRMIQLSIVFNVVLIIIIIMAGVSIAYILIRL